MKPLKLEGKIFGYLTVLHRIENSKDGSTRWLCKCTCGNTHEVSRRSLNRGKTKSCGCKWGKEGKFSKGIIPWNKGESTPEHVRKKQSESSKGIPAWNKGLGEGRNSVIYQEWRKKVLERDEYKCIKCNSEDYLCCDHIVSWRKRKDLRFEVSNGQTLCRSCHLKKSIEHGEVVGGCFKEGNAYWKGKKRSEETKSKISETKKGVKLSEETKRRMRNKTVSAEARKNMSEAQKRRNKRLREENTIKED